MHSRTLIFAYDLGTSALTATFAIARDTFDREGNLQRNYEGAKRTVVRDWPGGTPGDHLGNACLPQDLIFDKATGDLLYWGFLAQEYLDATLPDIPLEKVFVVQHPKLWLQDPEKHDALQKPQQDTVGRVRRHSRYFTRVPTRFMKSASLPL